MQQNNVQCSESDGARDRSTVDSVSPTVTGRTMAEYQVFMENILNHRFNFFMLFFSVVVAGALGTSQTLHLKIVLLLGTVLCTLIALAIARVQHKIDIALSHLRNTEGEPAQIVNQQCCGFWIPSMKHWIGYWIPLLCCSVLAVGTVFAFLGWLHPGNAP